MNGRAREKINDVGTLFRFITPTLLAVLGYLVIDKLNAIDATQQAQGEQLSIITIKVTRLEHLEAEVERVQRGIERHESRIRRIEIQNGPRAP